MDHLIPTAGTNERQKTETVLPGGEPQLLYDNMALPAINNPVHAIPVPTPSTWVDQQLGVQLDWRTPSLDDLHHAGMSGNNSATTLHSSSTASPDFPTPTLAHPIIPAHPIYQPPQPLPHLQKLMGSNTAFPVPRRLHTEHMVPWEHSQRSMPSQPPAIGQSSSRGRRATHGAVNMSMSDEDLPARPDSGGETGASTQRKRGKGTDGSASDEGEDTQEDDKLKLNRERNRLAAAKTRRKKKRSAKETEERAKEIEETNARLHQELRTLRNTFSTLRYSALSHDPAAGCTCVGIHQYNTHMAKEVAKEVAKGM